MIRGEVEREIQALVSKRDNVNTYHPYHAWDPVPSLSAASAGDVMTHICKPSCSTPFFVELEYLFFFLCFSRYIDQPREAAAADQHREGDGQHGLQTGTGRRSMKEMRWII